MRLAIITLTAGGVRYALKLKKYYPEAIIYTLKKHLAEGIHEIKPSLKGLVGELFKTQDGILFIMATGIVVRTIAPFIKHKTIDPAIMVMDEKGEFVISLLSGHIGKANEWAIDIASHLRALPVITTATDVNERIAVDTLADKIGCAIDNLTLAKEVTVHILENKKVGVFLGEPINLDVTPPLFKLKSIQDENYLEQEGIESIIIIAKEKPKILGKPYVWLIPKDVIVGIGCKRGKTKEELMDVLNAVFAANDIHLKRINRIVSVDIKHNEIGLLELARSLRVPFECIPREAILNIEDQFDGSDFVKNTLGVKAVSEPCGYLSSGRGTCLVPVQKSRGITISLWRKAE